MGKVIIQIVIMSMKAICLLFFLLSLTQCNSFSVQVDNSNINAVATYTWTITFANATNRNPITLTFPNTVTIAGASVTYNSATINTSINTSNSTITLTNTSTITGINVILIVTNVINPPSAFNTRAFILTTNLETLTNSSIFVNYQAGTLNSCSWNFDGLTEQINTNLIITINLADPITTNSKILVGSPTSWPNLSSKSLTSGLVSANISCLLSSNGTTFTNANSCTIDSSSQISVLNSIGNQGANSNIYIKIMGINSPPTASTVTNGGFLVTTTDSSGNPIDSRTNCLINTIGITNLTTGIFLNPNININVNSINSFPTILFPTAKVISFVSGDSLQYYFPNSLSSCSSTNTITMIRNTIFLAISGTGTSSRQYVLNGNNSDYAFLISIATDCVINAPPSESPVVYSFILQRSNSMYLQLNASLSANATSLASTTLQLNTTEMGANALYTFNILMGQPLSASPYVVFAFQPSSVTFGNVSACTIGLNASFISITNVSCLLNGSNIQANFNFVTTIPINTTINIAIPAITNPFAPSTIIIGVTTYYTQNDALSRVQFNNTAASTTFTVKNILTMTISPTSFTVFSITNVSISFNNPLSLPMGSIFILTFPSAVNAVNLVGNNIIYKNGIQEGIITLTAINANSISFQSTNIFNANDVITIACSITTPSLIGVYNYVNLTVNSSNVTYLQSLGQLSLNVNVSSQLITTVNSSSNLTGTRSIYTFVLSLQVPHPSPFLVSISFASSGISYDSSFNSSAGKCNGSCLASITTLNTTSIEVNVTSNSTPVTIKVSYFINPRNIDSYSLAVATMTPSRSVISQGASFIPTMTTNVLSGAFSSSSTYYLGNNGSVSLTMTVTNALLSGDYLLLQFDKSNTYLLNSNQSLSCSLNTINTSCSVDSNTSSTLVLKISPNISVNNTAGVNVFPLLIGGLVSSSSVSLLTTNRYAVFGSSYTGTTNSPMDAGKFYYGISCQTTFNTNFCQTCDGSGNCLSCYTEYGYFILNNKCTTNCGNSSSYVTFPNNSTNICSPCTNSCGQCLDSTTCITCINNTYFLYADKTCKLSCDTNNGYVSYINSNGIRVCQSCFKNATNVTCLMCSSIFYATCTQCIPGMVLSAGVCQSTCSLVSQYISSGICTSCNESCTSCTSSGNGNCIQCSFASGYYNSSGFCVLNCPSNTAKLSSGICGCTGNCLTCDPNNSASCFTCANISQFAYNGACIGACPPGSYKNGGGCFDCSSGCANCTLNTCISCQTNWYLYSNQCYTDCNKISQQYDGNTNAGVCVLCPDGCDTCNTTICTSCLSSFSLTTTTCTQTCLLDNSCNLPANSRILPLPGLICLAVWLIFVIILKVCQGKLYAPYSILYFSCVVQFFLLFACTIVLSNLPQTRLLYVSHAYRLTILILFGVSIALNYILNIAHVIVFVKHIKPLVEKPVQIDVIANVAVLVLATLTNFRLGLIAYSKMFPKPSIVMKVGSNLTPIHYICIVQIILDVLGLAGCGLVIYNEYALSDIFMLSIDLLMVILMNVVITIWMTAVQKSDEYFNDQIKKEYTEENHITQQEGMNEKNVSNMSKDNLNPNKNSLILSQYEDNLVYREENSIIIPESDKYSKIHNKIQSKPNGSTINHSQEVFIPSDTENHPLPTRLKNSEEIIVRASQIRPDDDQSISDDINFEKTLQNKSKVGMVKSPNKQKNHNPITIKNRYAQNGEVDDEGLRNKRKEEADNFGKQKKQMKKGANIEQEFEQSDAFPSLDLNSHIHKKANSSIFNNNQKIIKPHRVSDQNLAFKKKAKPDFNQATSEQKNTKNAKKHKKKELFDTDEFESNADEVDIDAIVRSKIVHSTMKFHGNKLKENNTETSKDESVNDEISPSHFNIQNQRIDISDYVEEENQ